MAVTLLVAKARSSPSFPAATYEPVRSAILKAYPVLVPAASHGRS
jgi:hypothetical protein